MDLKCKHWIVYVISLVLVLLLAVAFFVQPPAQKTDNVAGSDTSTASTSSSSPALETNKLGEVSMNQIPRVPVGNESGGESISTTTSSQPKDRAVLRVGETKTIGRWSIHLYKVISDSRCPSDVQCIWAGAVTVLLGVSSDNTKEEKFEVQSGRAGIVLSSGEKLSIAEVAPAASAAGKVIDESHYQLTVVID